MPNAIRIKTAQGWQDLAIAGPPGAQGQPGPGGAMQLIADAVLSAAGQFSFQNIPQTYADLMLLVRARGNAAGSSGIDNLGLRVNNIITSANYNSRRIIGNAASVAADERNGISLCDCGQIPDNTNVNLWGTSRILIVDYTSAVGYRTILANTATGGPSGAGTQFQTVSIPVGLGTTALTRIDLLCEVGSGNNFAAGSRATLYGIAGAGQVISPPTLVTSLPASPADGQEVYYLADATNGVIWHLRYRAASVSPYKWEFIGGPSLYNYVGALEQRASGTAGDLTTLGPDVTFPLPGDYDVHWGARMQGMVAGLYDIYMGHNLNSEAAVVTIPTQYIGASGVMRRRYSGLAAGTLMRAKYSSGGGNNSGWGGRFLEATPVRVG